MRGLTSPVAGWPAGFISSICFFTSSWTIFSTILGSTWAALDSAGDGLTLSLLKLSLIYAISTIDLSGSTLGYLISSHGLDPSLLWDTYSLMLVNVGGGISLILMLWVLIAVSRSSFNDCNVSRFSFVKNDDQVYFSRSSDLRYFSSWLTYGLLTGVEAGGSMLGSH